jgi:diguanylate cyclase (GGDEF)-like protein
MSRAATLRRWCLGLGWCAALTLAGATLVPARAQSFDSVTARILALEDSGRGRPFDAAQALEALLPATAPHGAQRLELLTVQGLVLAAGAPADSIEPAATRLEAWAREPGAPNAAAAGSAAKLVRARSVARDGNLQRADAMMQEVMATLPTMLLPRERFRYIFTHGYIKDHAGQLEAAVRMHHEVLAIADAQGDPWRQSEARSALAYSYYGAKQFERARAIGGEAVAIAEKADDPVSLGRALTVVGIVLDSLGDQLGERRSFEAAIVAARRAGAKADEARYLANLADFFLKNGEYRIALTRAEAALPLARDLKDANIEMVALANMGLAHIALQHLELGKRYVRDAIAIDEGRGSLTGVTDTLEELGTYLEKAGDLAGAASAYHQHRRLATTLLRGDQQKSILAMQEQYDADRRSRELALLNRENEIKAEQLHRRDLQQHLWWLLAAAFVMSFAVVGLLYRRVRQTNRQLTTSNEMLKVQGERDPLTGLANRRHFQSVMRQLADDGKLTGTVYLVDIDHFKHVNDRHGHSAGDAVLVEVAKRLRETLREEDLIVRWGGEEFLVVVQALAPDQVDTLAQRMLGALDRTPVACEKQRIAVTASIGYATFPIGPAQVRVTWERAINLVDTAMYLAKAHGRNRAYGVRLLHARDEASIEAITRSLETAWRDGQVALTLLQGRTPLAVAA